jgi:hypothetical protein
VPFSRSTEDPGWALSAPGESCFDACGDRGCSRTRIDFADADFELRAIAEGLGLNCTNFIFSSTSSAPFIDSAGACHFSDPGTATCAAVSPFSRFCCCSNYGEEDCPLPSPEPGWVLASKDETCAMACGDVGCSEEGRGQLDSAGSLEATMREYFDQEILCLSAEVEEDAFVTAPSFDGAGNCYLPLTSNVTNATNSQCETASSTVRQLCCCGGPRHCRPPPACELAQASGTEGGVRIRALASASFNFVGTVRNSIAANLSLLNDTAFYNRIAPLQSAPAAIGAPLASLQSLSAVVAELLTRTRAANINATLNIRLRGVLDFQTHTVDASDLLENNTLPTALELFPDFSTSYSTDVPDSADGELELNGTFTASDANVQISYDELCDFEVTSTETPTTTTTATSTSTTTTASTSTTTSTSTSTSTSVVACVPPTDNEVEGGSYMSVRLRVAVRFSAFSRAVNESEHITLAQLANSYPQFSPIFYAVEAAFGDFAGGTSLSFEALYFGLGVELETDIEMELGELDGFDVSPISGSFAMAPLSFRDSFFVPVVDTDGLQLSLFAALDQLKLSFDIRQICDAL